MEFDAGIPMSRAAAAAAAVAVTEGASRSPSTLNEDAMWQMNLLSSETMDPGPYPERPGEPDCSYYIRTGLCRFGVTCRFNHPPNRKLYYLKTGTCKFGATCKFHHPRDKAGFVGRVALNILGYPLRPNETQCAYYLRTGQCKFGSTCKFHHPQPTNMMVSLSGSPVYPTIQSPTTPTQQSYPGGITNWSRASFIASPRWQGPSSYAPLLLPQGVLSVPGWNAYSVVVGRCNYGDVVVTSCEHVLVPVFGGSSSGGPQMLLGQLGSVSSSETQQQSVGNSQVYGTSRQGEQASAGSQGTFSPLRSGSVPMGFYALQRENVFPERPGQPECQFYMKTGDCKFGAVCRFHHPRERLIPAPDCVLSPIGLPLRPGEPLCIFYSRYGICKFGPSCKFDHPMGIFTYNHSASFSADVPIRRLLGSSSGPAALNLSTDGLVEAGSAKPRRLSLSETRQMPSGDDNVDTEG
ncbi:Zinc finger CCCH domain-containing protein ZFN-like [Morella rubra]|uniref:Zinc finger CCCH domain-containing protein ZFN-like n=1 Tax=Morella rubra TaxID=262757 RepID=A0A6A1UPS4_9ROSI|nr:Zinc finger CCCH domain-containing protein ZFN-like [Morella rubra]